MKSNVNIAVFLALVSVIALNTQGQTFQNPIIGIPKLASPSKPVDCETMLEFIDDALSKATKFDSDLVLIIKSKKGDDALLNTARSKGLLLYLKHRRFQDFQIGVDVNSDTDDRVDLVVLGRLLYSLPIDSKDDLDLTPCVIGDI